MRDVTTGFTPIHIRVMLARRNGLDQLIKFTCRFELLFEKDIATPMRSLQLFERCRVIVFDRFHLSGDRGYVLFGGEVRAR